MAWNYMGESRSKSSFLTTIDRPVWIFLMYLTWSLSPATGSVRYVCLTENLVLMVPASSTMISLSKTADDHSVVIAIALYSALACDIVHPQRPTWWATWWTLQLYPFMIQFLSTTYQRRHLGCGLAVVIAFCSKSSIHKLQTIGDTGHPGLHCLVLACFCINPVQFT